MMISVMFFQLNCNPDAPALQPETAHGAAVLLQMRVQGLRRGLADSHEDGGRPRRVLVHEVGVVNITHVVLDNHFQTNLNPFQMSDTAAVSGNDGEVP